MPNIDLPDDFPERLRRLRIERGLSENELAAKANINPRTIRQMEKGKRQRSLEKTLMLLAEALEVTLDELLGRSAVPEPHRAAPAPVPPPPRRRPRLRVVAGATLAVLAVAAMFLWQFSRQNASWENDRQSVVVRDGLFGLRLWELRSDCDVRVCELSPWRDDWLLVGLGAQTRHGGRLLCLERATGDTVWCVQPDVDAAVAALGPDDVYAANFGVSRLRTADVDGDGRPELVVTFVHGALYPTCVRLVTAEGRLRNQYVNKGHINDLLVVDLDHDGKDEVVASGTNNDPAYQGATVLVLDDRHWRGASVDSVCNPWSAEPDSALVRIVMPQWPAPYMQLAQASRLHAVRLNAFGREDGRTMLLVDVAAGGQVRVNVVLDDELRPKSAYPTDAMRAFVRSQWPDSLTQGKGPADEAWLAAWLATNRTFRARPSWPETELAQRGGGN